MTTTDIKDTIECRKQLIAYIEYLQKDNERISDELLMHTAKTIFSKASLIAFKQVLDKATKKLSLDVDGKKKTMDEAAESFNEARDLAFKHCLILELKHKHFRKNSVEPDSEFANLKFA